MTCAGCQMRSCQGECYDDPPALDETLVCLMCEQPWDEHGYCPRCELTRFPRALRNGDLGLTEVLSNPIGFDEERKVA